MRLIKGRGDLRWINTPWSGDGGVSIIDTVTSVSQATEIDHLIDWSRAVIDE